MLFAENILSMEIGMLISVYDVINDMRHVLRQKVHHDVLDVNIEMLRVYVF